MNTTTLAASVVTGVALWGCMPSASAANGNDATYCSNAGKPESAGFTIARIKDGYGLGTPDAIEHWTASLQKKAASAGFTIVPTKDGYGLRTPDAIEHWTASLQKKAASAGCTLPLFSE